MAVIQIEDLAAPSKPLLDVTPSASAEMKRLLSKQSDPEMCVRVGVRGGGCAGLNYDMKLDKPRAEGDRIWDFDGVKVIVDRKSILYLAGIRLDFSTDLLSGGFKFDNPNAVRSCGCGYFFQCIAAGHGSEQLGKGGWWAPAGNCAVVSPTPAAV